MNMSVKEVLLGKTRCFEALNVEEAVKIAHQLKASGTYDLFRGQVRDYPPHSSMHRLHLRQDPAVIDRVETRYGMFCAWLNRIPELRYLLNPESVHDFFAIMQHYGVPTNYIDFTTDPDIAGFFACDTKAPPTEGVSCIYCLKKADLEEAWSYIHNHPSREGAKLEIVSIDVRNLWRLQAQKGVFVFSNYGWEIDYPLDKIVFPYTGYPDQPPREKVYPEHKSPLEQLLDQYFDFESGEFAREKLINLVKHMKSHGGQADHSFTEVKQDGYYPEVFQEPSRMTPLESWDPAVLIGWDADPEEDYFQSTGPTHSLNLSPSAEPDAIRNSIRSGLLEILGSDADHRSKTMDWKFHDLPKPLTSEVLSKYFRLAWNGMRRLPYSDEEIGDALGSIAALMMVDCGEGLAPDSDEKRFSGLLGETIVVGFSYRDGAGSRGWVSRKTLLSAMRPDMVEILAEEHKWRADNLKKLFQVIYSPSLMFDFAQMRAVFAREIIPSQIVRQRNPVLFNPARLWILGNI